MSYYRAPREEKHSKCATPELVLQWGDRLIVVGDRGDVQRVADTFGNELKQLDLPNLLPVFFGIVLGIYLGLLPIPLPFLHQTFRLGLAGGAHIIALPFNKTSIVIYCLFPGIFLAHIRKKCYLCGHK